MIADADARALLDPLKLMRFLWPSKEFYDKQREIVYSVRDAKETYVPAGNQLGKDYVAGYVCPAFFLKPQCFFDLEYVRYVESLRSRWNPHPHTVRILTTSVAEHHLKVLWGEIGRAVTECQFDLIYHPETNPNGLLTMNYQEIRYARERQAKNPVNYLVGRVSAKGEGLAGHHAAYTLCVVDEASGSDEETYTYQQGWAKRLLAFGNPHQCENWWRRGIKAGDLRVEP